MVKLKPCPFCGGKAIDKAIIHSNECFILKLLSQHNAREIEDAWQIRATDPLLKEMAEALQGMADIYYGRDNQPIAGTYARKMDEVLQKYYEQEGE